MTTLARPSYPFGTPFTSLDLFYFHSFLFRLPMLLLIHPFIPPFNRSGHTHLRSDHNEFIHHRASVRNTYTNTLHRLPTAANNRLGDSNSKQGRIGHQIDHYVCVEKDGQTRFRTPGVVCSFLPTKTKERCACLHLIPHLDSPLRLPPSGLLSLSIQLQPPAGFSPSTSD